MMQQVVWNNLTAAEQRQILARSNSADDAALSAQVKAIIAAVRADGDQALFDYTWQFDRVKLTELAVTPSEFAAAQQLSAAEQQAILTAAANIRHYHSMSSPQAFSLEQAGRKLGKIYRAIEKVGLYIPGGSAPLVSTLLMLAVPAALAGCQQPILLTPPGPDGRINPALLFAAQACGIEQIFKVGGAQAIAALAFGTESIPKTYKIFGPGNKYVTEAKLQVAQSRDGAAFDLPAGPSEVLVIADAQANPRFVASDLLAQAEHDSAAQVILVTTSAELAQQVAQELVQQMAYLSRAAIIQQALAHSAIILAADLNSAFAIANQYAPEHLILHLLAAETYLPQVSNAGSIFLGAWTPEAVGDYASGTNHVLPTYGYAQMYSGLDVQAFMKAISFQQLTAAGLEQLAPTVTTLTDIEGLDAHKNAVNVRLAWLEEQR